MGVAGVVSGHHSFDLADLKLDIFEFCLRAGVADLCHEVALHELQLLHPGAVLDADDQSGAAPASGARVLGQGGSDDVRPAAPGLVASELSG